MLSKRELRQIEASLECYGQAYPELCYEIDFSNRGVRVNGCLFKSEEALDDYLIKYVMSRKGEARG